MTPQPEFNNKPVTGQLPKPLSPVYHLYIDDTGTRYLDRLAKSANEHPRWFALGGMLVAEEDEAECKRLYEAFYSQWPRMTAPLHITDMRARRKGFSWLQKLSDNDQNCFWQEYRKFLVALPVIGNACVIHRPGYLNRGYGTRSGDAKWNLCRTAFNILVERSAKFAHKNGRRLRTRFEGSDKVTDQWLKNYFTLLKAEHGLGFNPQNAAKYEPMDPKILGDTLIDLERKDKQSKLMQIADSYVYAIARGRYESGFDLHQALLASSRLINAHVTDEEVDKMGVKYSCFDGI